MGDPLDRALDDLDESRSGPAKAQTAADQSSATNDRTILGVGTPRPTPDPRSLLQARPPIDEPPALVHSEQSPLSFVMRAGDASPGPQKEPSHDMSMFVEGLVAETSPVVETVPAQPVMEPVMRTSRKRRQWIVASAITATAIVGALAGVHLAAKQDAPKIAAKQDVSAAVVPQTPPPAPAIAPPPQPAVAAPPVEDVAAAPVTDLPPADVTPQKKVAPKALAPKKVATATTTTKKSSKKSSRKKPAVAKKTTAKKATSTKKTTSPTKKRR